MNHSIINYALTKNESHGVMAALASLLAATIAGLACIGPLLGIMLGIGGMGWLSHYTYLTIPASIISLLLMVFAVFIYRKRTVSCASRRKHRFNQLLLGVSVLAVVGINSFEFIILPNLS